MKKLKIEVLIHDEIYQRLRKFYTLKQMKEYIANEGEAQIISNLEYLENEKQEGHGILRK